MNMRYGNKYDVTNKGDKFIVDDGKTKYITDNDGLKIFLSFVEDEYKYNNSDNSDKHLMVKRLMLDLSLDYDETEELFLTSAFNHMILRPELWDLYD